ncbi:MAG: TonB-dependent receptor [Pseudomonadales bacterium]
MSRIKFNGRPSRPAAATTYPLRRRALRLGPCIAVPMVCVGLLAPVPGLAESTPPALEEIVVWGKQQDRTDAGYTNPTSLLTQADMVAINATTTEDLVKYEPNLVIRKRFIGDSNGTLGMRGANMFQTSRAMVFADGVPLHYLLQSRFNGAPRWTMVSAAEIAHVETVYGPYSAEYSGNALGGVVLIETAIPQTREFNFEQSFFSQSFDAYGFEGDMPGYRSFASYGDRFGNASVYVSLNRLENESQPMTFYSATLNTAANAVPVTGAESKRDELGVRRPYFGDTGRVESATNNLKIKVGYDWDQWSTLLNVAYEDRNGNTENPNSYLRDADGSAVWSGNVVEDGVRFSVPASRLNVAQQDRHSLSLGLRVRGQLSDRIELESNVSRFAILEDETRASARNPQDPAYTPAGEITAFGDSGWDTAEVKVRMPGLVHEDVDLVAGLRHEAYQLDLNVFASDDWARGIRTRRTSRSGGETAVDAAFLQGTWRIDERWDATLGVRHERFESSDGFYSADEAATPELDLVSTDDTRDAAWSPKLSIGFRPAEKWQVRYSLARAWRFPIVEELFSQYQAYNAVSVSNPDLKPEDAVSQNLMIDREIDEGYLRLNVFQDTIDDVIESQGTTLPGGVSIRTFVPIDTVRTRGVELVANRAALVGGHLDLRFNLAWTDSDIIDNAADPRVEGNSYPRMPDWRGNLLSTWRFDDRVSASASVQYASDSFGRNDNRDREYGVMNAQDGFLWLGLKGDYARDEHLTLSVGIDNLTDTKAWVAHPWPGRTWYGSVSYAL